MTTLITGATGTVGRSLASELAATGTPVRALVRDAERARTLLPDGVELAVGDFTDRDPLAGAGHGRREVVLGGAGPPTPSRPPGSRR